MDIIGSLLIAIGSGLVSLTIGGIAAYFGLRSLQSRVKAAAEQFVVEEVTAFLKLVHEKPEMFAPVANGFINDLTKIVQLPNMPALANLPSGDTLQAVIPMLPRKWRGPAMLASMFMKNDASKKPSESQHPFAQ